MGECDWFKTAALRVLLTALTEVDIDAGASATNCHCWALASHRRGALAQTIGWMSTNSQVLTASHFDNGSFVSIQHQRDGRF